MPMTRQEASKLKNTSGKGFGRASPDRNAIVKALADGNYYTPEELAKKTGLDSKVVKTRCTVMVRDKLTDRRYNDAGIVYFGLTADKGMKRATVKNEK